MTSRDRQHGDNRDRRKPCRQPKHRGVPEVPAQQAGYSGPRHVAGVVVCLVAAVLTVESCLADQAKGDADQRGCDGCAGDAHHRLGSGDHPKLP